MTIIFETARLILRQFTAEDATLVFELNSSKDVLKYLHEPILTSPAHAREIIQTIILPQYEMNLGRWATFTKDKNEFIGWCGLKFRPELEEIDLGYRFKKEYWGKGYATEAARHSIHYGLTELDLPLITGRAHIENIASLKILEKIGMQFLKEEVVDNCPVKTYTIKKKSR